MTGDVSYVKSFMGRMGKFETPFLLIRVEPLKNTCKIKKNTDNFFPKNIEFDC